jgi:putative tryptophan/tyrosine transport system substrate-binding protein
MPARLAAALLVLAVGLPAGPVAVAQPAARVYRVGVLLPGPPAPQSLFHQGLRELGYVEGQNLVLEQRWAEHRYERLPGLAAELVQANVDVIFAATGQSARAAQQATRTIPIVFETLSDPVAVGLVPNLARPGGNMTGVSGMSPQLNAKRLELLKGAVPGLKRVAILHNPTLLSQVMPSILRELEPGARALGLEWRAIEARQPADLPGVFTEMARQRIDGFVVVEDSMLFGARSDIVRLAAKHRLPGVYSVSRRTADAGGLLFYGFEVTDLWRRAAHYVDRILKGARPADLPVEQPTRFQLVVNLKTARALGLTIPPAVLARADDVIR